VAGASCVQTEPSHCQVSPNIVELSRPPNNSVRPRSESNAIAWSRRGVGAVAGVCSIQCVPSHSHVSVLPNRTVRARIGSYTDAAPSRHSGLSRRCVQLLPFHSQVSSLALPCWSRPPNKTVQARLRSYAIPPPVRVGGLAAGRRCAQFVPSHSQVSVKPPLPK